MTLTASSAETLNARWHDQPLDIESLKFDQAKRECVFYVLEGGENDSNQVKSLVRVTPLQRCRVTVRNITGIHLSGAEGEVELYIVEVRTTPNRLSIKCVNGLLELSGHDILLNLEEDPLGASGETQVALVTPVGNLSWRKKQTGPKS